MNTKFKPGKIGAERDYFVEVIAQDGVKHHVGPFRLRSRAEDWIAMNCRGRDREPRPYRAAKS